MTSTLEASIRMGARNGGMRNICELLLNVVQQAKDADRPGSKGKRYGWSVRQSLYVIYDSSGGQTGANPSCIKSGTW